MFAVQPAVQRRERSADSQPVSRAPTRTKSADFWGLMRKTIQTNPSFPPPLLVSEMFVAEQTEIYVLMYDLAKFSAPELPNV
jgi:hypothetical protein